MRVLAYRNGAVLPKGADAYRYKLTPAEDAVWPPVARAYGGPPPGRSLRGPLLVVARLILPVILTAVLLAAAYLYADDILDVTGGSALAMSDLVLPLTWFSIQLTNRRYGPGYALAQLLVVLGLAALVALTNPHDIDNWVTTLPAMSLRAVLAFGVAFFSANFVAITLFDAARGPRWWTAPLVGSCAAALVFSAIYYPLAGAYDWNNAVDHFAVFLGVSVAMLAPYWLLRPAMRPMPGLNGY